MNETFKLHDQHLHTSFSHDAKEDIENYARLAKAYGTKYFITTEHYELKSTLGFDWLIDFEKLKLKLAKINETYGLHTLLGIELGYREELVDALKEVTKAHDFDLILLSMHSDKNGSFYRPLQYELLGVKVVLENYFSIMERAVKTFSDFDVLAHFDYAFRNVKANLKTFDYQPYIPSLIKVFKALIKNDKCLEINLKVQSEIDDSIYLRQVLKLYYDLGGRNITLSSDSHNLRDYQKRFIDEFAFHQKFLKEIGFSYLCYYVKRERKIYPI